MKCVECNRVAKQNNDFCFYHDPSVSDAEKQSARSKGGRHSRKITPWSGISEIPPIENIWDLKRLYNSCLGWLISGALSPSQARAVVAVGSGLRDYFELEIIADMVAKRDELLSDSQGGTAWRLTEK